jgi:hypothetical protein
MSKQKKVRKISSIESTTNIKGFNAAPHLLGGLFREVLAFCAALRHLISDMALCGRSTTVVLASSTPSLKKFLTILA